MRLTSVLLAAIAASAFCAPVQAAEGDWLLRARGIAVVPQESAKITPVGGSVNIDNSFVPEVDATYFTGDHWAFELIAATTEHSVRHTPTGLDIGSVWLLPPTLTAQYHFNQDGEIRPYIGAGINYTIFYNVNDPAGLNVHYSNNFGWALQAGVDIPFGHDGYFFNLDVKKLFLSTNVNINSGFIKAKVDIDPWIIGAGVGLKL
ncbi:MAG: OmpW family protein [Proteobacteria bacterium]|nr:OmpW family protein [Pseudomonadota bacterium]